MNRLYIVSSTELNGAAYGNIKLGLSSPMFKVITSIGDTNNVPNDCLYTCDECQPLDSVEIRDLIDKCGGRYLPSYNYINQFMELIYKEFSMAYDLYKDYLNDFGTKSGINRLTSNLSYLGLTPLKGYKYIITRDLSRGYFSMIPESPLMEVIINLFIGWININKPGEIKLPKIEINDPNNYFKLNKI